MAFDEGRIFEAYQGLERDDDLQLEFGRLDERQVLQNFKDFIKKAEPQVGDRDTKGNQLYYLNQLIQNKTHLTVDLEHVRSENRELATDLEKRPSEMLPLFERAAVEVLAEHYTEEAGQDGRGAGDDVTVEAILKAGGVQLLLCTSGRLSQSLNASIRDLAADRVNQLVMVTGIVTAASKPKHKAVSLTVQCKTCKGVMSVACRPGMGGAMVPSYCTLQSQAGLAGAKEKCEKDPYQVLPDQCKFVDQQTLKLQEKPEDVPTGEMPRAVTLVVDRQLVGRVTPGTRVTALGIYSTFKGHSSKGPRFPAVLQQPYIRVVSLHEDAGDSHSRFNFTQAEISEFERFAQQERVHDLLFSRIAPNIFGSEDIKRAVACLLFGGSRKTLPDGTARRGDINVLLLGDPSTAKSQFLKFASKVAPISVYTSGKGSSAAGLTASVVQDPGSREFYLEGGAMVLADNGVVCIDEFDKMRPEDRVAIHEAMEQQTISIAKAGITTMLKSRSSVLAAANPPSGRYDDLKSAQDNMDLQSTILSRFDLIFIVKDPATEERDAAIARKVLENHRTAGAVRPLVPTGPTVADEAAQEVEFLRRYIHYARTQCNPRLGDDAHERLAAYYVEIREEARKAAERDDTDVPPVPVTVRQLEALVRISESLARMALQTTATLEHVEMAIELFRRSTMDAVKSGVATYNVASDPQRASIHRIEEKIRRRVHIGGYLTTRRLLDELVALGDPEPLVMRALCALDAQGEFQLRRERSVVHRLR